MTFNISNYHKSSLITDSVNSCLTPNECPTPYSSMFCWRCPTWNSIYTQIWAHLHGAENSRQMWLSVPYSECRTLYSHMFCSRCPTWNSIYTRNLADLYEVKKILLRLEHIEFMANVVICAITG